MNSLYYILLIMASLLAVYQYTDAGLVKDSRAQLQKELTVYATCGKEEAVPKEVMERVITSYEVPTSHSGKCFASCHLRRMKMMSDDAIIDWDRVDEIQGTDYIRPDEINKAREITQICRKIVKNGGDHCETAYQGTKCFLDHAKKVNLPIVGPDYLQKESEDRSI